ncbi:MAG: 1,4-alpha-glucan branching protein GlgB [Simkaniaceae bacterium]|nr:1,4-alpha-glucan branching protein GlgB [Simkaniaceae bacterium]
MDVEQLHRHPHRILGLHDGPSGKTVRLLRPEPPAIEWRGTTVKGIVETGGIVSVPLPPDARFSDYLITYPSGLKAHDPYSFSPTFSQEDEERFSKGIHEKIYEVMGGRITRHQGVSGVKFTVWAPCAQAVSVIGDFNKWEAGLYPMRIMDSSGVWELFLPGLGEGERYRFHILSSTGHPLEKSDPYALRTEMRPATASIVAGLDRHVWQDGEWMAERATCRQSPEEGPLLIYEVHPGSWKRGEKGAFLNYRTLAVELARYCKKMGYTHVELMPIMEHPLDESWGYQVTGFYAISSRFGSGDDLRFFVDHLHGEGIGVLLDWVPGHFPSDEHALACFDGTCLYEHLDPRQGLHPEWETRIFNYGRYEVANFLIGSALFYLDTCHIDGLRVDAVSSMVYLNYGRKEGEWIPNQKGGPENLEAVSLLRRLNTTVAERFPGVMMIAEESHGFPKVTHPPEGDPPEGGLGFHLSWGLGWMHDTLSVFTTPFAERPRRIGTLIHEMGYYYREKRILTLSHDEVVHGKKSLLGKMPGNEREKFANLRLLFSYMICHPGKKLLFMGGEFGLWNEWDCTEELPSELTALRFHKELHTYVREINKLYVARPALWERDFTRSGFLQVETDPYFAYLRIGNSEELFCAHNFSDRMIEGVTLPWQGPFQEILNSDGKKYGGSGMVNANARGGTLCLAPFATSIVLKCPKTDT